VEKVKAKSPPAAYRLSARKSSGELSDSQDSDSADTTLPSGNKAKLVANVDIISSRFVEKPVKGYEYRGYYFWSCCIFKMLPELNTNDLYRKCVGYGTVPHLGFSCKALLPILGLCKTKIVIVLDF
jgi:hypothetical protein